MFPVTVPSTFSIIAHRGASGYAPENTMPAFELARRMGVREVEFDVQLSADRRMVICHDPVLERFGYPDISIAANDAGRLRRLDMGSHFSPFLHSSARMPLLDEVFDLFGREVTYHVELKSAEPDLPGLVLDEIESRGIADNCVVISFHPAQLARSRDIDGAIRLGWSVGQLDERVLGMGRELDLFSINPPVSAVTAPLVEQAHGIADEVLAWGLDGAPEQVAVLIEQVVAAGCDGMFINWPDWAVQSAA